MSPKEHGVSRDDPCLLCGNTKPPTTYTMPGSQDQIRVEELEDSGKMAAASARSYIRQGSLRAGSPPYEGILAFHLGCWRNW